MDTVVKSHYVATHKKMHQTNWLLPRKVKHAFLIVVADRQQRKALHHCILSLSESSHRFLLRCSVQDEINLPCTGQCVQEQGECIVGGQTAPPAESSSVTGARTVT